jgi:hypothetical protein
MLYRRHAPFFQLDRISFYFNEIGATHVFAALAFHWRDWMRYLARKKALESEA